MSDDHKPRPSDENKPTVSGFIFGVLSDMLRYLLSSVGFMFAGALGGAALGAGGALYLGLPFGTGLIVGAVAGFLLAMLILAFLHGGW
jgi:hypothetical protein